MDKPGAEVVGLRVGVAGGYTLTSMPSMLRLGTEVETQPGIVTKKAQARTIASADRLPHAETSATIRDPRRADQRRHENRPDAVPRRPSSRWTELLFLLHRLLGVKTVDKKWTKVAELVKVELLLINMSSMSTGGRVLSVPND
ncbi:hypothetical protein EDB87DRAFT_1573656 [Lactarius vividus]|nr:hypothetical protein EDB87DRAFT_1573656 [Lactarius vividus]